MWMKLEVTQAEPAEQFSRPLLAADAGVQVFFFFFFLVSQGQGCCEALAPCPLQSRGARCTHQPVWKPAFSRILPEGVT